MGCRFEVGLKCEGKGAACVGWRLKVEVHVEDRGELEAGRVDSKWGSSVRVKGPQVWGEEPQSGSSCRGQKGPRSGGRSPKVELNLKGKWASSVGCGGSKRKLLVRVKGPKSLEGSSEARVKCKDKKPPNCAKLTQSGCYFPW